MVEEIDQQTLAHWRYTNIIKYPFGLRRALLFICTLGISLMRTKSCLHIFQGRHFLRLICINLSTRNVKITLADFCTMAGLVGSRTFQSFIIVVSKSYFGLIQDQLVHFSILLKTLTNSNTNVETYVSASLMNFNSLPR